MKRTTRGSGGAVADAKPEPVENNSLFDLRAQFWAMGSLIPEL